MTLYRKSVVLRNFDVSKDVRNNKVNPSKGMEVAYKQLDNRECYGTFIDNSKENINNKLAELNNNIASDRVRTLNSLPKYRIINTKKERIQ